MQRVVILGRGASGKSTLAQALGAVTKRPVMELDKLFWQPGLLPTPRESWSAVQERLAGQEQWIMDGAIKRSRERADFWRWLLAYRRQYLPLLLQAIAQDASTADVLIFRDPRAAERFLNTMR